jgi:hypothetical protein
VDFAVDCVPVAKHLIKAVALCDDVVSLRLTDSGRLRIESGPFKTFIPCVMDGKLPHQEPEGDAILINGDALYAAMKTLAPVVGNDATRPWSNGMLLRGASAYATNNVVLCQYWTGVDTGVSLNLPMPAIREMLRVAEPPVAAQATEHSATFHYADGRWIRTQLLATDWPDIEAMLTHHAEDAVPQAVPDELGSALDALKPFLEKDANVYFVEGGVATMPVDNDGSSYAVPGLLPSGIYKAPMLRLLQQLADRADFTRYPAPVPFHGDNVRGVIMGVVPVNAV